MLMFYDSTYLLVFIGFLIVMYAQHRVKQTFNKYNELPTQRGISGRQAAEWILQQSNLAHVPVERVPGYLTDHYDPAKDVLRLSQATYDERSVAAVAVAAHECGHAIQDAENYGFLRLRTQLVPLVNLGSSISLPLILFGLVLGWTGLTNVGIIAFSLVLVFQLVTLPVEFDASKRALVILEGQGIFAPEEMPAAKKVLRAAAFTYIAASLSTALQLVRFILLANSRRRR